MAAWERPRYTASGIVHRKIRRVIDLSIIWVIARSIGTDESGLKLQIEHKYPIGDFRVLALLYRLAIVARATILSSQFVPYSTG